METIEIQCGNCNQMMAILVEHLGTQVHCPHCQAVVQTPDTESVAAQAAENDAEEPAATANPPSGEHIESIFAEPDRDDLFDTETPQPRIEMPSHGAASEEERSDLALAKEPLPDMSLEKSATESYRAKPAERVKVTPVETAHFDDAHASSLTHDMGMHDEAGHGPMPAVTPRKRSMLIPTLLIFLVPYSITATVFAVLLMVNRGSTTQEDPMQRIPDPDPNPKGKKGPPRKVVTRHPHDAPLPPNLVTSLRRPVRVGDIEVTPLEVRQTPAGNLSLRFKARNLAKNVAFIPTSKKFLDVFEGVDVAKPYTFLHSQDKVHRVYGGFVEYQNDDGEPDLRFDGELQPGKEGIIQITTLDKFKEATGRILKSGERCVWRIQVRRGLVDVEGYSEPLSATAVIGIEFAPTDVIRDRRAS